MDLNRSILDNLMGRDRNMAKNASQMKDHYSNNDVCKPFLICFCFHTLFPNTIYDQGPCPKRHDTYLKTMFESDINRSDLQREYIRECIQWIQKRLKDGEEKTKKNQAVIDNKSSFPGERPRQVLDRILAIDKDIQEMTRQAQIFGEIGQIDDSARCLQEIERLRDRRRQIELMGDNMMAAVKQQKICQICGAIQTINDTEKRIQTHLEGKIHQGFLKLRNQIETLKIRLEIIQMKVDQNKPVKEPSNGNAIEDEKPKEVKVQTNNNHEKQRERSHSKKKKKQHKQNKEKDHHRQRKDNKRSRDEDRHYRSRSRSKKRDKQHKKKHKRERSSENKHRDRDRDRHGNY